LGQPLAVLESSDLRTAYADYDRAKILLALATKNRDRVRGLGKIGGIAEKDLLQVEADFATAEAEFQRAEARLKQIGVAPDTADTSRVLTILSPIAGSVIDLVVSPGAFWNDPTAPLMTVADLTTIWVTATVPEKDISVVAQGQSVDVNFAAYPGEVLKGHVLFISDVLDPDTRRAKSELRFPIQKIVSNRECLPM
jgi:cobalt-zinc-cadmium efflux system membrane fusion protein